MRKTYAQDPDTEPIVPVTGSGTEAERSFESETSVGRRPPSPKAEPSAERLSVNYEFTSPEAALLACTCTVALAMATGVWPRVEMQRSRLRLAFPAGLHLSQRQRAIWADLPGWARRLGGRPVADPRSGA